LQPTERWNDILINIIEKDLPGYIVEEKKKMKSNTEDEYEKALASEDPTKVTKEDLEKFAKEAAKKFKSLS